MKLVPPPTHPARTRPVIRSVVAPVWERTLNRRQLRTTAQAATRGDEARQSEPAGPTASSGESR